MSYMKSCVMNMVDSSLVPRPGACTFFGYTKESYRTWYLKSRERGQGWKGSRKVIIERGRAQFLFSDFKGR